MFRTITLLAITVSFLFLGTALASPEGEPEGPVKDRMTLMENNAAAMKAVVPMIKGEVEYDAARAGLAMRILNSSAHAFEPLFPESSKTGGHTTAGPAIWAKRAEFKAANAKFAKDTAAAIKAAPRGLDAFKAAFGAAASNCRSCHHGFRVKKK